MSLIIAKNVSKVYRQGETKVTALDSVSFQIAPRSFVSFVGPSGSGKTTLLNLMGILDNPTSGRLEVAGIQPDRLTRVKAAEFRGENLGFIFQDFNLIPVLTVFENVEYPLLMVKRAPQKERKERVLDLLQAVGMTDQRDQYPSQISGGQKQRVAVARALVTRPRLVLADEPTANLDTTTALRVIDLMHQMRDEMGVTFVFSTHDPKVVRAAETTYTLTDGRIDSPLSQKPGGGNLG